MIGYIVNKIKTRFWTGFYYFFKVLFFKSGTGCKFEGWIAFPQKGGNITINDNVHICMNCEFSVTPGADLQIGKNVFIGRNNIISCHEQIVMGDNSMLTENVCIHDNNHEKGGVLTEDFESEPIIIGENNWLAASSIILKGVSLNDSLTVAAGAVVNHLVIQI